MVEGVVSDLSGLCRGNCGSVVGGLVAQPIQKRTMNEKEISDLSFTVFLSARSSVCVTLDLWVEINAASP